MRIYQIKFFLIVVCSLFAFTIAKTENISGIETKPSATVFAGISNIAFSSQGNYVYFQSESFFIAIESERFPVSAEALNRLPKISGTAMGFLPSEKLLYIENEEGYALDITNGAQSKLFSGSVGKLLAGLSRSMTIIDENLILAGDGSYDWGGEKGNIHRFNPKSGTVRKAAVISGMFYPKLSQDGKYLIYDYGAEENTNAYLYDLAKDKNYPIAEYFNFKQDFKGIDYLDEVPVAWLKGQNQFLAIVGSQQSGNTKPIQWLVRFNVESRKIVWKSKLDEWFFPSQFHQIDSSSALVGLDKGVYRLSLQEGKMTREANIDVKNIAPSADGKNVTFLRENQLFVSDNDGQNQRLIHKFDHPLQLQTAYKGMGERPLLWVGKSMIIVFDSNGAIVIRLASA